MRDLASVVAVSLSLSLSACVVDQVEEGALPDELDDGKADSLSAPTKFGRLYNRTWQYGELAPDKKERTLDWRFDLTGDASVRLTTRVAPTATPELDNTVVYLYKQSDTGSWKLLDKSAADDFGVLAQDRSSEGAYRVIVKGHAKADSGRFMLRMDCEGDGCPKDESILDGKLTEMAKLEHGALIKESAGKVKLDGDLNPTREAQFIVAVNHEARNLQIDTMEESLAVVDEGSARYYIFRDTLGARTFVAFTFKLAGESRGRWYPGTETEPTGLIIDGVTTRSADNTRPATCAFGQQAGDASYMPYMRELSSYQVKEDGDITSNALRAQLLDAVRREGDDVTADVATLFDAADDATFTVTTYETEGDDAIYTGIEYRSSDAQMGAFYVGETDRRAGEISHGVVETCGLTYRR